MQAGEENSAGTWDFFDRVYCISLYERTDRRKQVQEEFAAVGLSARVEFVLVNRHPRNREQGIFESHILCLRRGLASGAQTMLLFEDDVFFRGFSPSRMMDACAALAALPSWRVFFLGCITSGSRRLRRSSLAMIRYRCLSHGYAIHRDFAEIIVEKKWQGVPYDTMLKQEGDGYHSLSPMCAFQGVAGSDNQTVAIDRLRRLCGGLPFLQRINEFYQNNKIILLVTHLAVFGMLASWWLR